MSENVYPQQDLDYGYQPQPPMENQAEPTLSMSLYGASPIAAFRRFWSKYAVFSGGASRSEFWWVQLILWLVLMALPSQIAGARFDRAWDAAE